MEIAEAEFENEAELDEWTQQNIQRFLPRVLFLRPFRIQTTSGKGGIPDGFAFDLSQRQWFVIEAELLKHGVWPHIAEQISRFVVAVRSSDTLRLIRDKLFEYIVDTGQVDTATQELETTRDRLLQQLELFVETVSPGIVVFIDDTNQDLIEFAHALNLSVQIFRVKKLLTDGKPGYYSPDRKPVVETELDETRDSGGRILTVLEQLGGGQLSEGTGRFKCYRLEDGRMIRIHYSKLHQRQNYYWYGIAPSQLDQMKQYGVSHVVFILGEAGFVTVPIGTVLEYMKTARTSDNPDGTVRHYHVLISREPEPKMYWSSDTPSYPIGDNFETFR